VALPTLRTYLLGNLPDLIGRGLELLPHIPSKVLHILNGVVGLARHNVRGVTALDVLDSVGSLAGDDVGDLADLGSLIW